MKKLLILSIIQLVIGLIAIVGFIIVIANGENVLKWIITLILAISYVVLGIIGIIDYEKIK